PSSGDPLPDAAIPAAPMDTAIATSRENPAAVRRIGHTVNVSPVAIQPTQFLPWGTRYRLAIIRCLDHHANCCGKEIVEVKNNDYWQHAAHGQSCGNHDAGEQRNPTTLVSHRSSP